MSDDTDPPTAHAELGVDTELKFHKDFASPSTATTAILQVSDGTCFRFDLSILALFSSFFADLKSLLPPSAGPNEDPIIELPSTTAGGLHFALSAIKSILHALETADAYDIPVVFPSLLKVAEHQGNIDLMTVLVTAILAQDKRAAEQHWVPVLANQYHQFRTPLVRVLEARKPGSLAKLVLHQESWKDALDCFEDYAHRTAKHGFQNLFAKPCRGDPPCAEVTKWKGNLERFISREARKVRSSIAENPQLLAEQNIYVPDTRCMRCCERARQIIHGAISSTICVSDYKLPFDEL